MLSGMTQQIAIRLDEDDVAALDRAVAAGHYSSRAAAVREGVRRLVRDQRNHEIAADYRRAYGQTPQEPWFAEASARAAGELLSERSAAR